VQVETDPPLQVWKNGNLALESVEHDAQNWWAYSVRLGLKAALDCFQQEKPFPVLPEDALQVLRIIRAAYCSTELKRQIDLDEFDLDRKFQ